MVQERGPPSHPACYHRRETFVDWELRRSNTSGCAVRIASRLIWGHRPRTPDLHVPFFSASGIRGCLSIGNTLHPPPSLSSTANTLLCHDSNGVYVPSLEHCRTDISKLSLSIHKVLVPAFNPKPCHTHRSPEPKRPTCGLIIFQPTSAPPRHLSPITLDSEATMALSHP